MKKLELLLVGIIMSLSLSGQYHSISLSYTPVDHGVGIKGLWQANKFGIYSSVNYGTLGNYALVGYHHHVRSAIGISIPFASSWSRSTAFTIGLTHHYQQRYATVALSNIKVNYEMFQRPMSFELGIHTRINRLTLGARTDILRWEPCIDIGIAIRKRVRIK